MNRACDIDTTALAHTVQEKLGIPDVTVTCRLFYCHPQPRNQTKSGVELGVAVRLVPEPKTRAAYVIGLENGDDYTAKALEVAKTCAARLGLK